MIASGPFWEDADKPESLADVVDSLAVEGMLRTLLAQLRPLIERAAQWSEDNGLSKWDAAELDRFHREVRLEVITAAARLGYALAVTRPHPGTFEAWLQNAIAEAGLDDYKPFEIGPLRHRG